MILRKDIVEEDKAKALELRQKLTVLKNFQDKDNIFLDFSAKSNFGIISKQKFRFKIFYKYESKI